MRAYTVWSLVDFTRCLKKVSQWITFNPGITIFIFGSVV
jgi:hypothetical protein